MRSTLSNVFLEKRLWLFVLAILLFFSFMSCRQSTDEIGKVYELFIDGGVADDASGEDISEYKEKLFIKDKNKVMFETNNPKYYSLRGYTLWKYFDMIDVDTPSVSVEKRRGAKSAGYGIVCYYNEVEVSGEKQERMLCVLVYVDQTYSVGYVINNKYKDIVWRKKSESLKSGFGVVNSISVRQVDGRIEIYFNAPDFEGDASYIINESNKYLLGVGMKCGLVAVISPDDKFPNDFVEIEYTINK